MAEVIWTNEAEEDLNAIAEYIARDSEYYAWAVVDKLLDLPNKLVGQP